MTVEPSEEQEKAHSLVAAWLDHGHKRVFRLFGYAGTGKTTLAKAIAADVKGGVRFGAFTGKAASVMRAKGCDGATTLHRILYRSREIDGQFVHERRSSGEITERLLIVDEVSMVNKELTDDLLNLGRLVLVLGDPFQLPPIGSEGILSSGKPDVVLQQVHRQGKDSPVLELATKLRRGGALQPGDYGESRVLPIQRLTDEDVLLGADQILVGRNDTRQWVNRRIRQLMGHHDPLPVIGDRLVCLRNSPIRGLFNGTLWSVVDCAVASDASIKLTLVSADDPNETIDTTVHRDFFEAEDERETLKKRQGPAFSYGYALTAHKAQGSQWDRIVVFDESETFKDDAKRWLYTAITRASKSVTVLTGTFEPSEAGRPATRIPALQPQ